MKCVKRGFCFVLILLLTVTCMGDKQYIQAHNTGQVQYLYYSGILGHSEDTGEDDYLDYYLSYYLNYICFDENVDVKVLLELDVSKINSEKSGTNIGGHVQFALTKDEAHSKWMDDLPLYPNVQTSYTETFSLYKGYYTIELHLIRDEYAYIPFKITLQVTKNDSLPDVDTEATIWLKDGWEDIVVYKGEQDKKIDMYQKLGISSWNTIRRKDLSYSSSNVKVAIIDKRGILRIKKTGVVKVTICLPNHQYVVSTIRVKRQK